VRLFEAGRQIAGLAKSFHDADGFTYDFGAHFITNRLAAAIGISSKCMSVPHYGETVYRQGRTYGYPFGLLRRPSFVASALAERLTIKKHKQPATAAEWFVAKYGRALAEEVAIPLAEAWSGLAAEELSAAVGESIPGSIAGVLLLTLARRVTGRVVAIGYSREVLASPHVWHVYPQGGLGVLCQRLAEDAGGIVELESPVEAIYVEDGRAAGVRVNGKDVDASAVISTAPVHVLPKLMKGSEELSYLARFRYRPMVFVNLRLKGRGLLPDVVTWTPEKQFPFFRLTETPLSMPWLAPEGKTLITVDIGCQVGDSVWSMEEAQLGDFVLEHLGSIIPNMRARYLGCRVLKTPIAYPVFAREYEAQRQRFASGSGISGLFSIGRNGEFSHIFMEDVYWRALKKARAVRKGLAEPMPDLVAA
jgi:protoporphyrinogen oxidase